MVGWLNTTLSVTRKSVDGSHLYRIAKITTEVPHMVIADDESYFCGPAAEVIERLAPIINIYNAVVRNDGSRIVTHIDDIYLKTSVLFSFLYSDREYFAPCAPIVINNNIGEQYYCQTAENLRRPYILKLRFM
jgi:hypothetical protein